MRVWNELDWSEVKVTLAQALDVVYLRAEMESTRKVTGMDGVPRFAVDTFVLALPASAFTVLSSDRPVSRVSRLTPREKLELLHTALAEALAIEVLEETE